MVDKGIAMVYPIHRNAPNHPAPRSCLRLEKELGMKVQIRDICTACGFCCDTCPEVFEMGDEIATVIVDEVPAQYQDTAEQAAAECPVEAIVIERD